jgi:hypothetical protein
VFCRNVLIYFDNATKTAIFERLVRSLARDGFLVLGAAETVVGLTDVFLPHPDKRGLYVHKAPAPRGLGAGAFYVTALCGLSGILAGVPAQADDPLATAIQPLPAVDGLNGTLAAYGGSSDGQPIYGVLGSISVPLGFRYGLQIDGQLTGVDARSVGQATGAIIAGHLFWRDPTFGLLGLYGQYKHVDVFKGVHRYQAAFEGALYAERFSLEAFAGVEGGSLAPGGPAINIPTRFYDLVLASYYPADNLRLSVGHRYLLGLHSALARVEWGFPMGGGMMPAVFVQGAVVETGAVGILGGLRLYFGQRDKSLMRRQREDDPINPGSGGLEP